MMSPTNAQKLQPWKQNWPPKNDQSCQKGETKPEVVSDHTALVTLAIRTEPSFVILQIPKDISNGKPDNKDQA